MSSFNYQSTSGSICVSNQLISLERSATGPEKAGCTGICQVQSRRCQVCFSLSIRNPPSPLCAPRKALHAESIERLARVSVESPFTRPRHNNRRAGSQTPTVSQV